MFKRYMAFLLAIIMLLSLSACGKDKKPEPTNPQVEQTTPIETPDDNVEITEPDDNKENNDATTPTENDKNKDDKEEDETKPTEPEKEVTYDWTVKYMDTPVFGALKMSTRDITAGVRVNIAQTPFTSDFSSIQMAMEKNEYLKKHFSALLTIKDHEMLASKYYKDTGNNISYIGREGYGAQLKNSHSQYYRGTNFEFGGRLNTADYYNYESIYMTFTNIPKNVMNQDEIYTAAETMFGDELADFLVYAEDFDNVDSNDNELGFGELYETISALDNTRYFFERRIVDNGDNTYSLRFEIGVEKNQYSNGSNNYFGELKPAYVTFLKTLREVLPKSVGNNQDITLFRDFASNYFNGLNQTSPYAHTQLNKFESVDIKQGTAGGYQMLDVEFGGVADNGDVSKLAIFYEYTNANGKLDFCQGKIIGTTYNFANIMDVESQGQANVYKAAVKDIKNALSMIFIDADFSGITFNEGAIKDGKFTTNCSVPSTVLGQSVSLNITVEVFTNDDGIFGQFTASFK